VSTTVYEEQLPEHYRVMSVFLYFGFFQALVGMAAAAVFVFL